MNLDEALELLNQLKSDENYECLDFKQWFEGQDISVNSIAESYFFVSMSERKGFYLLFPAYDGIPTIKQINITNVGTIKKLDVSEIPKKKTLISSIRNFLHK